jgi:ornithine--oxo-acid transaminase
MSSVASVPQVDRLYSDRVNPQWVRLLKLLQMNARYERCRGSELFTADGRRILDFLSGYCVHNTGHNHPALVAAVKDELDRSGPVLVQSCVPELAAQLADRLVAKAGGRLRRAFFCSSGSEGVEAAIKFARAHTRREGLLCAQHAFHGLTCGALSLMGDSFWREGFGPMLADTKAIPFGSIGHLEEELATKKYAAFVAEPVQAEGGIQVPSREYWRAAESMCRRYGTLLVLDEVQTGMYRTGEFLAAHHFGVEADIVVLGKALSGGLIPVAAVLTSEAVSNSMFSSLRRSIVHASTYGEDSLAMRAGLATLDVLDKESLGERALALGELLRRRLQERLAPYEMVKSVRGLGLLNGIEFAAPKKLHLRTVFEAFHHIHPAMFGQVIVMRLFRDHNVLTQICGNNFMVLKVAPPLVVTETQIDEFVQAIGDVVELAENSLAFWNEALGLARRAVNI